MGCIILIDFNFFTEFKPLSETRAVLPALFSAIRSAFDVILTWIQSIFGNIVNTTGQLYTLRPFLLISFAVFVVLFAIALIRRVYHD